MTKQEVLSNLCYYDLRNHEGAYNLLGLYEDEEFTNLNKENCYCDNCFYGRTKLAEYILTLL